MSRLQLTFNGGELDPDEYERVDLEIYNAGLALGENVVCRPHGGISRREGTEKFARLRHTLSGVDLTQPVTTFPNGGDAAALLSDATFETSNAMVPSVDYVVAEFDFGHPVTISCFDVEDYYLNDGSAGAGQPSNGGTGGGGIGGDGGFGGGSQPSEPLPTRPRPANEGNYVEP